MLDFGMAFFIILPYFAIANRVIIMLYERSKIDFLVGKQMGISRCFLRKVMIFHTA